MKKKYSILYKIFLVLAFLVPFIIAITNIYLGKVPFWYDPARDLLMALDNHQKISLIGQTSGIPGIFYGPYWIWSLSLLLFITHDPKIITLLAVTIPYFVLFPLILFKFKKYYGSLVPIILWLLFILAFSKYATQLWNPHPAPILCLLTIYLLISHDYTKKHWKELWKLFVAGLAGGLLINLHISFGLATIIGSLLFLAFSKNRFKTLPLFIGGILIMYLPFIAFEVRHGFNQAKTLIETVTSDSAVVSETSVKKIQIFDMFFATFTNLLQVSTVIMQAFSAFAIGCLAFLYKKKKLKFSSEEKKITFLILLIMVSTLSIYLATKNPVWEYHFIGMEILFLLLVGLVAAKVKVIKYLLLAWVLILVVLSLINFSNSLKEDRLKGSSLVTKEHIVNIIYNDSGTQSFHVYIFSPATYTPDYDYLLKNETKDKTSANLERDPNARLVYLIIPWTTPDLRADFIDNRTPNKKYKTVKTWHIPDETMVIKRVLYEKQ